MADRQPLFVNTTGLPEEMADADSLDLGALTMSGDIAMGGTNEVTGLPAIPSATGAASKEYLIPGARTGYVLSADPTFSGEWMPAVMAEVLYLDEPDEMPF